jgi:hypothetical protein
VLRVRRVLRILKETLIRMTGAGAAANARIEIDDALSKVEKLDAQLGRLTDPSPRRAA